MAATINAPATQAPAIMAVFAVDDMPPSPLLSGLLVSLEPYDVLVTVIVFPPETVVIVVTLAVGVVVYSVVSVVTLPDTVVATVFVVGLGVAVGCAEAELPAPKKSFCETTSGVLENEQAPAIVV